MTQYFLTVPGDTAEEATLTSLREADPAELAALVAAVGRVNSAMREAGAFVHAGGLQPPSTAVTIDATGSEAERVPGPFADATHYVGGFWIIDVPDNEAALGWAERCSAAARSRIEVRALQ
ncbi:YciI family protein [Actinoplanes oblitus]|uniref:YciI family protein n=1 Tax=Actinoplanes oblitus TaxID=3040509 RepID=A0ABY8WRT1_9ACTN|nr:YciI family protein [Actinoplanes oblitus]WIN00617.1 YciI family protein [Actinoplanes oblitus]